jgi:hypothetical protein
MVNEKEPVPEWNKLSSSWLYEFGHSVIFFGLRQLRR